MIKEHQTFREKLIEYLVNNPEHGSKDAARNLELDLDQVIELMVDVSFRTELSIAESNSHE